MYADRKIDKYMRVYILRYTLNHTKQHIVTTFETITQNCITKTARGL